MAKLNIAIVGGGIGGLSFAVALSKLTNIDDFDVHIYEAATKFGEIGAGIAMWPRVWEIMKILGLDNDLAVAAGLSKDKQPDQVFHFRKADQYEYGITFGQTAMMGNALFFHRPQFQDIFMKHLPETYTVHFSKKLMVYNQAEDGRVFLQFGDGSGAICDVLIAADGIKSATRSFMYKSLAQKYEENGQYEAATVARSYIDAYWSGTVSYRGLIPRERLDQECPGHRVTETPMMYFGKDQQLIAYQINTSQLINVVALCSKPELEGTTYDGPWVTSVPQEEVIRAYDGWEPEIIGLLKCVDTPSRWAINCVGKLPTYVDRHVALIGDAAHAMTPHQGSGAGQAIEDGFILATLLAHSASTAETIPHILRIYDNVRRPFSQDVQQRSRDTGLIYELRSSGLESITVEDSAGGGIPVEVLESSVRKLEEIMSWLWSTSIADQQAKALQLLEEDIQSSAQK